MIQNILATKQPKVGNVQFIAIDGHGGSGKSTLAQLLSEKLGAQIVHTDDFSGWDNPLNWWPLVIERVFEPIQKGAKTLSYPRSKWWKTHNPEPVVDQPVTPIMILEGVSSSRSEFRPYLSLSILVNTPKDICFERGLARDRGMDGKSGQEIMAMWQRWYEKEELYFARDDPKGHADIVVDGTQSLEQQIK
jgi:uridine kinase